ncbi:hypothetical protein BDF14DRAFT_1764439 [Spinellus fusiger]|nr:hypothetical protein BDF14DRAFT_1764439 [Spinellus fusiger]
MKDKTLRLWNRDLAATLNFRHSLIYNKIKHKYTTRTNKRSKPSGSFPSFSSPVIAGASVD